MRYCCWNVGRYCHPSSGVSTSERVKESIKENNEVSKNGYVSNITQLLLLIIFLLKRHDSGTFLCLAKHYRKIVLVLVLYYLSKRSALPFFPDSETFLCLAKHYRKIVLVLVLVLYYLSKRSALPFFPGTTA